MRLINIAGIRACTTCAIIVTVALLSSAAPQFTYAEDRNASSSPSAILSNADDPQNEAVLLSSDLILYASAAAERNAINSIAENSIENTQVRLITAFLKALEERLYAWRNSDELLNAALGDLISEFAVMHRFYAPQDEYKLFYEKSVHIRMNTFENLRQNAGLKNSDFLNNLLPGENGYPGEKARLYAYENPLLLDEDGDRVTALLILHLLKTTPNLNKLWRTYMGQSEILFGESFSLWKKVQDAARHLPLGRDTDLCDSKIRIAFRDNLRRTLGDFSRPLNDVEHIPLSLLAMISGDIRSNKRSTEPVEKQILELPEQKTQYESNRENLAMSLFCVEHGKVQKTNTASKSIIKEAYIETAPKKYNSTAAHLKDTASNIASIGDEFKEEAGRLSLMAAELETIAAIQPIYGDGAVSIAKVPASLLEGIWLKALLSDDSEYRCIYDTSLENNSFVVKSGVGQWIEQSIDYLLPLEEAPELEGNAELEEAPALVIPDSRKLIRLVTARLVYRRQIERISTNNMTLIDTWSEMPFAAVPAKIPLPD